MTSSIMKILEVPYIGLYNNCFSQASQHYKINYIIKYIIIMYICKSLLKKTSLQVNVGTCKIMYEQKLPEETG